MELNKTPVSNRIHISFFGRTNAGKSSLVNAFTGQNLSVVSDISGTTTDPVSKTMELLPLGPVLITDTPGFDDHSALGDIRIKKAKIVLRKTDIAVLVTENFCDTDKELISLFKKNKTPYIVAFSKSDLIKDRKSLKENEIYVSSQTKENIDKLKDLVASFVKTDNLSTNITGDFTLEKDLIVLVTPIDESAPKGRLILPQVQTIRDILDHNGISIVLKTEELDFLLNTLKINPKVVITDSQVFGEVAKIVPSDIHLTSFSILMAKQKGFLSSAVIGAKVIKTLKDNDKILISEGCTHHRQCKDIGTVKLPKMLEKFTGKHLQFVFSQGGEFPEELQEFKLIIHCGACMLNNREIAYRKSFAEENNVPFTNYGTALALMNNILDRSLSVFPEIQKLIKE